MGFGLFGGGYLVCLVIRRDYREIKKLNCRHDHIDPEFHSQLIDFLCNFLIYVDLRLRISF